MTCSTDLLLSYNGRVNEQLRDIYRGTERCIRSVWKDVQRNAGLLFKISDSVALLDMLLSFAHLSKTSEDYCCPEVVDKGPVALFAVSDWAENVS